MKRTNIYLEDAQLRALKHLAAEGRQSVADLVRQAVDDYLAQHMADGTLWRERFDALLERVRSRAPGDFPPARIEAEVSAAGDESAPSDDPTLAAIVHRLVEAFRPERIYLFGSKARGDAGAHSDYDVLVVVSQTTEPSYRLAQKAHTLLWDIGVAADILVWGRDAFESRLHLSASLPSTVVREGKLLYTA